MSHRALRLLRGWAAALIVTGAAAGSHVLAGGSVPAAVVLTALALSGLVCVGLAGRSLSRWWLGAGVLASQALFHGLFGLAGAHYGPPAPYGPAAHQHHGLPVVPALTVTIPDGQNLVAAHAPAGPAGTVMLGAHLLAAVLTIAMLRHGEATALRLHRTLAAGLRALLAAPGLPAVVPRISLPVSADVPARAELGVPLLIMRYRGPPHAVMPG